MNPLSELETPGAVRFLAKSGEAGGRISFFFFWGGRLVYKGPINEKPLSIVLYVYIYIFFFLPLQIIYIWYNMYCNYSWTCWIFSKLMLAISTSPPSGRRKARNNLERGHRVDVLSVFGADKLVVGFRSKGAPEVSRNHIHEPFGTKKRQDLNWEGYPAPICW